MSEDKTENIASAVASTSKAGLIMAWTVPLVAVVIAGWLVWRSIPESSAIVTVRAASAEGLSPTHTQVKYRGVPIGIVSDIALDNDLDSTLLTLELDEGFAAFAQQGAQYWIVRPEFSTANFESLRTIVSGPYIAAHPGSGAAKLEFEVLEHSPAAKEDAIGMQITLITSHLRSIKRNTKISWRGKDIGQVLDTTLDSSGQEIAISVGLHKAHQHLLRKNSVFWNSGGLDVEFGLFKGAEVRAESMQALLQGDISAATPEQPGEPLTGGEVFTLQESAKKEWLEWSPNLSPAAVSSEAASQTPSQ
ncbi:MAG: MlaD family protein [Pseudomonadales bacterium]